MRIKRALKWSAGAIALAAVSAFAIAYWRSSNACDDPGTFAPGTPMKAIVYCDYGGPEVLTVATIEKPAPADNQLLIKVRAVGVNPFDWHYMRGTPYVMRLDGGLRKPSSIRLGVDYAGTVEAVGKSVTTFKPGDEVFGGRNGALAEYLTVLEEGAVVPKPANVTFEQAASVGIAGITALQALRDRGQLQRGQKVLILDNVGNRSLADFRRVLKPEGKYVLIGGGGPEDHRWIGPLGRVVQTLLLSPFVSQDVGMFLSDLNKADLAVLCDLMEAGQVTPVIDRRYPFDKAADAIRYLETGRARSKVVVTAG